MTRAAFPKHAPALVRAGYAFAGLTLACSAFAGVTRHALPLPAWIAPIGVMVLATLLCATRVASVRHERAAWGVIAVALACWTAGDVLTWLRPPSGHAGPADAVYLANYLLGYAGHLLLLRGRVRPFRGSMWLDGVVMGLALGALAALLLEPVVAGPVIALAYPVADVILLSFVVLVVALLGRRPGIAWLLILGGLVLSSTGDAVYVAQTAAGAPDAGVATGWLLPASGLALSLAAWMPARLRAIDDRDHVLAWVTVALGVLALAILGAGQVAHVPTMAGLLAIGAVAAGLARGALAFRENAATMRRAGREARTDPLSGLGNRRALLADLTVACTDGREHTLAFFDLDGFKGYNDAFGHGAGDDLLSLLAADLRAAVTDLGHAYRLGGDEFCVLAAGALSEDDPRTRAVRDALTHASGDMAIAASLGIVHLPDEAGAPGAALQLADERMYADKNRRRAVA